MKVFYDYEIILFQKYGGVSRYFYELVTRNRKKNVKIDIPLYSCRNYYFRDYIKGNKQYKIISPLLNEFINNVKLFFNNYDIIHPTYYYAERFLKFPWIKKKSKIVITVYDMIHELVLNQDEKFLAKKKKMILMADGIICISESTKQDLLKLIPEASEKEIAVIYLGNSLETKNTAISLDLPNEYILFVGSRGSYKNFATLLKSFPNIKEKNKNIKLLCVGGGSFSENEKEQFKDLNISDSVIQMSLSDEELEYAYKHSKCFIFPSLYEGFGLPILEAYSCGCPVILSDRSCFPEIAGDAALYFDGEDFKDLENKVNYLLENVDKQEELKTLGFKRLKNYSWSKCADETLEFYKKVLK